MAIKTIGILGAGAMGSGIAQVAAMAGYDVIMRDLDEKFVQGGIKGIDKFLTKSVEKGKMTADDKTAVMGRIKGTARMEDLKDVDFIVEAIFEDLAIKQDVFRELDELTRKDIILATNTSSLPITEIAAVTSRPEKVVGLHFFNPVPLMRLVEVIRGHYTNEYTVALSKDFVNKVGKESIEVKIDSPGFVVNRLMVPHFIEAISLLQEGIATAEDIDKAAKLGLNYPMGPFELMDMTGVDIALHVINYFHQGLNKELKWVAPRMLNEIVKAKRLGKKSGAGWYVYDK
jgi:3-hydroxybutyryl-CoA dehydrogenase